MKTKRKKTRHIKHYYRNAVTSTDSLWNNTTLHLKAEGQETSDAWQSNVFSPVSYEVTQHFPTSKRKQSLTLSGGLLFLKYQARDFKAACSSVVKCSEPGQLFEVTWQNPNNIFFSHFITSQQTLLRSTDTPQSSSKQSTKYVALILQRKHHIHFVVNVLVSGSVWHILSYRGS